MREKFRDPMKRKRALKITSAIFLETTSVLLGADAYRQHQEGNTAAAIVEGAVAAGIMLTGFGEIVGATTEIREAREMNKTINEVAQVAGQIVESCDSTSSDDIEDQKEDLSKALEDHEELSNEE